jgi:DNA recombination-mediator protein A
MREHLCVSQFPAGSPIQRHNFPLRNRTMALLSDVTVIIEATEHLHASPFLQDCFGPGVTLVSIPRSSPRRTGFLWPAERICACLLAEGLGHELLRCLERIRPVQRASLAAAG